MQKTLKLLLFALVLLFVNGCGETTMDPYEEPIDIDIVFIHDNPLETRSTLSMPVNLNDFTYPHVNPSDGYTFAGWFMDEGVYEVPFEGRETIKEYLSHDRIYVYAKWIPKQFFLEKWVVPDDFELGVDTPYLETDNFINIETGYSNTFILSEQGFLYGWGSNSYLSLLDDTFYNYRTRPYFLTRFLPLEEGEIITDISSGSDFSLVKTSDNRLFTWGRNAQGQLGNSNTDSYFDHYELTDSLELEQNETVTSIFTGEVNGGFLTSNHRLYLWGDNTYYQVLNTIDSNVSSPRDVTSLFNLNDDYIVDVFLGNHHLAVLTNNNQLFMWGDNTYGQLGDGTTNSKNIPINITSNLNLSDDEFIESVVLAEDSTILYTNENRIFIWGDNTKHKLNVDSNVHPNDITNQFLFLENEEIIQIDASTNHFGVLTNMNRIFTWGDNIYGQLGLGYSNPSVVSTPTIKDDILLDEGELIVDISYGDNFTTLLTSNNRAFTWGDYNFGKLGNGAGYHVYNHGEVSFVKSELEYYGLMDFGASITDLIEKSGYTYQKWYEERNYDEFLYAETMPNKEMRLFAVEEPVKYTITYDLNNGVNDEENPQTYTLEDNITLKEPTRTGYDFEGWYSSGSMITDIPKGSSGDLYLEARWSKSEYTINYVLFYDSIDRDRSNVLKQTLAEYEDIVSLETLTKEGYIVNGWYSDELLNNEITSIQVPDNDVNIYGYLTPIVYQVNYHLDGGLNASNNFDSYIIEDNFILEEPTREGYTFIGWYSDSSFNSNQVFEIDGLEQADIDLYAKWHINSYTISYLEVDNSFIIDQSQILIEDEIVEAISVGRIMSGLLTSNQRLFVWSNNIYIDRFIDPEQVYPYEITDLLSLNEDEEITKINFEGINPFLLTSENRLLTFIKNDQNEIIMSDLTPLFDLAEDETITSISVDGISQNSVLVLTSENRVFAYGEHMVDTNTIGILDTPLDITSQFDLKVDDYIVDIFVNSEIFGSSFCYFGVVTEMGDVFTWGVNHFGQLGFESEYSVQYPTLINDQFNLNQNEVIVKIVMNDDKTIALTNQNRIFYWGKNIGVDSTISYNIYLPDSVNSKEINIIGNKLIVLSANNELSVIDLYDDLIINLSDLITLESGEYIESFANEDDYLLFYTSLNKVYKWYYENETEADYPYLFSFVNAKNITSDIYEYNESLNDYILSSDFYSYSDWYISGTNELFTYIKMPADNIYLFTIKTNHNYSISYHLDEGTNDIDNPDNYTYEDTIILNNPNKIGYTFLGWYDNPEFNGEPKSSILNTDFGNIDLYAKWQINSYNIDYSIGTETFSSLLEPNETIIYFNAGLKNSSIITSNHRVFVWGYNRYGQVGDGTTIDRIEPVDITSRFNLAEGEVIVKIKVTGNHSIALSSLGRVFTFGYAGDGQLGNGYNYGSTNIWDITANFNLIEEEMIIEIDSGLNQSIAITSLNRIFTWGCNEFGQLGNGTIVDSNLPVDITNLFNFGSSEGVESVTLGWDHSTLLTTDKRLFAWGSNHYGEIGIGEAPHQLTPLDITANIGLLPGEYILYNKANWFNNLVITSTGRVFVWGINSAGELGDGTNTWRKTPVEITGNLSLGVSETIELVELGVNFTLLYTSNNRIITWGNIVDSQIETTMNDGQILPIDISDLFNLDENETIIDITIGNSFTLLLTSENRLLGYGSNSYNVIGIKDYVAIEMPSVTGIRDYYFAYETIETETYLYQDLITLIEPTLEGYTFSGWYIDNDFTTLFDQTNMGDEDITLYGYWIE